MSSQAVSFYGLIGAMLLFFMAFNLLEVMLPAQVSRLAPVGSRGTAMGIYSTAQFAGAFVGGVLGGFIVGEWEISYLMYVNIAVCLGWMFINRNLGKSVKIKNMTLPFTGAGNNQTLEALSSVAGVVDVIVLEASKLVCLKVDSAVLDETQLNQMLAALAVDKNIDLDKNRAVQI